MTRRILPLVTKAPAAECVRLFGGLGPFFVRWLIKTTGSPLAPTWYAMAGLTLSIIAVACIPAMRHVDLDARRKPA